MKKDDRVTLANSIEAEIAQSALMSFMRANLENWSKAEPIGRAGGMFIVLPPGVDSWQVLALDHQGTLTPCAPPLMSGFVYRVSVEVIEPIVME